LLKNKFFGNYFILEKVWKIIHNNDKDLTGKEPWFSEFLNCFLKEKSVDYVHGVVHWVHGAGSRSMDPSLNVGRSSTDKGHRLTGVNRFL
jgi:hypothetical protein